VHVLVFYRLLPSILGFRGSNLGPELSLCIFFSNSTKRQDSIPALIPQSLQLQAQVILVMLAHITSRKSARICVRIDQCVSAVTGVEVPAFFCLRSS